MKGSNLFRLPTLRPIFLDPKPKTLAPAFPSFSTVIGTNTGIGPLGPGAGRAVVVFAAIAEERATACHALPEQFEKYTDMVQ